MQDYTVKVLVENDSKFFECTNSKTGEIVKFEHDSTEGLNIVANMIDAWELAKLAFENAKLREMELRKLIVEMQFNTNQKGTQRVFIGDGQDLKAVIKKNYGFVKTFDGTRTDKDKIDDALDRIEQLGSVEKLIADRLVKWTPDLSMTEYNKLGEEGRTNIKAIIDSVLVITDGAPTLEITAAKKN